MHRRKILFLTGILLFLFSYTNFAQNVADTGSTFTLQQCVDIAIKNNLLVNQSELQMQTNGVYWKQAIDNLLPIINASGSQGINSGRSINNATNGYITESINSGNYNLNAGLTLFSGLQLQNAIKQNGYSYDATKLDWQQQKDNITLNVLLAYLQVLSSQDLLEISRRQADVDAKQVARLEIQNKEGALNPPSNLYDLKGQYASDLVNIVTGVNALETAKINLFQLLNIPYKRDAQYQRIPSDTTLAEYQTNSDSIYQAALHTLPLVRSADLRVKSYEKALKYYRGQYYPTLSLYAGVSSNYSSAATTGIPSFISNDSTNSFVTFNNTNYTVISKNQNFIQQKTPFSDQFSNNRSTFIGLQLQVPILNSFRARNNVKLAKINLRNSQYTANATRNQLQQMVEQAYQNMISAHGQYKSYQDQVAAYAESFRMAEIKFNAGVITSVDYVIAKNNIDRANSNLTAARYNYIFRTKILDYYQGRLTY